MIRRFRLRREAEEVKVLDMEVSDVVDMAVDALEKYGVMEMDYPEGEEPEENEAICVDEDGNQALVSVMDGKLMLDLDEEDEIVIDLDQVMDDAKSELEADLEEKFNKNTAEEARRRFELRRLREKCKRTRKEGKRMRKEGKRIRKNFR